MNSASSWLSVSAVSFEDAETNGWATGSRMSAARTMAEKTSKSDFMHPPINSSAYSTRKNHNHREHGGTRGKSKSQSTTQSVAILPYPVLPRDLCGESL